MIRSRKPFSRRDQSPLAELYLSAGFESLTSRRFKKPERPASWLELSIYDMGSMRNAYSVFSVQRRAGAEDAGFTRFAYLSGNALFFVNGRQYVEIIAADGSMRDETYIPHARDGRWAIFFLVRTVGWHEPVDRVHEVDPISVGLIDVTLCCIPLDRFHF